MNNFQFEQFVQCHLDEEIQRHAIGRRKIVSRSLFYDRASLFFAIHIFSVIVSSIYFMLIGRYVFAYAVSTK